MAHSPEHNPVSPEALELGYQPEAVPARGLLIFLVLFIACGISLHAVLWVLTKKLEAHAMKFDVPRSAVVNLEHTPPAPQLQPSVGHDVTAAQDMDSLRSDEDAVFLKMGWKVNGQTHEVDIPPDIVRQVAEDARVRASAPYVPPTTTGKQSNSIIPPPPENGIRQAEKGGQPR